MPGLFAFTLKSYCSSALIIVLKYRLIVLYSYFHFQKSGGLEDLQNLSTPNNFSELENQF
jgi:hypothetical protein